MTDTTFVYVTYIATTTEKLWEALTSSKYTEQYFSATTFNPIGKKAQTLPIQGMEK